MKATAYIFWILMVVFLSSCAIPVPHMSTRFQGVSGQVFDERTKRPISGVHVSVDDNPSLSTTTDSDGAYSLERQHNFHVLYVWFMMGDSLPGRIYWAPVLNFSHSGYQPLCYNAKYDIDDSLKLPRNAKERSGNLTDTDVFLKKR